MSLGCPQETAGKTPLLNKTHALVAGHREIKLELSKKLPFCQLAFIMLEVSTKAAGEEKVSVVLMVDPACYNTDVYQTSCAHCYNNGTTIMEETNHFLTELEALL